MVIYNREVGGWWDLAMNDQELARSLTGREIGKAGIDKY